jgi:hypothetical protein
MYILSEMDIGLESPWLHPYLHEFTLPSWGIVVPKTVGCKKYEAGRW